MYQKRQKVKGKNGLYFRKSFIVEKATFERQEMNQEEKSNL